MSYNLNWFQSVDKKPIAKAPPFSKTLQIDQVAIGSPAAELKLKPGDKLLSVNGKAAIIADIPALLASGAPVNYRFFLPRETAFLEVETQGLPLGIVTSVSSDAIIDQYKSKAGLEYDGLFALWERGDYGHIKQVLTIVDKRLNRGNLVGKLIGKRKTFGFGDLMKAICDIEAGKVEAGYKALNDFSGDKAYAMTSDVRALADYYRALDYKGRKNIEAYQSYMNDAYSSYPDSGRIRNEAVKAGVEIDRPDPRIGTIIQTAHEWNVLEGGQGVSSLAALVKSLSPGQMLPICFMPAYRGNGPYNDALLPYIATYPYVSERLHPIVVLTNVADKRKDRPHWNSHEALAKKLGCPFMVLCGGMEGSVEDFKPRGAPEFFVINKDAKIIWAGDLDTDFAYWEMLSQIS